MARAGDELGGFTLTEIVHRGGMAVLWGATHPAHDGPILVKLPKLAEGEDPAPTSRVFWCVMLTLVPLAMLFSKASLETMKTAVVLTAIPFLAILAVKVFGLFKWLLKDYAATPTYQIEDASRRSLHEPSTKAETTSA